MPTTAPVDPSRRAPLQIVPLLVVALPAVLLAALGTLHPRSLTAGDALLWRDIHVVGLVVFPLLGLPPWYLLRVRAPRAARAAAVLGYLYAAGYTALDVLAGIGAGSLALAGRPGRAYLYAPADVLGLLGALALLAASVVAVVGIALTVRARFELVVPGGLLVLGASVSFLTSHIFPPRGVLTMLAFALGWALLALATRPARRTPQPVRAALRAAD